MGKTYQSRFDEDYDFDMYDNELNLEIDDTEKLELFLDSQHSLGRSKRSKAASAKVKNTGFDEEYSQYRLPRDWRDFDYTSDSSWNEEW